MRTASILVIFALALAGCTEGGGDSGPDPTTGPTTDPTTDPTTGPTTDPTTGPSETTTTTTTATKRDPVTWTVRVEDNAFAPDDLTVQVGDTVRWVHEGDNPHTVTADDGTFDSHPDCTSFADAALGSCMAQGDTFEWTFDQTGTVDYLCKIHGPMTGVVEVLEQYDETP